MPPPEPAGRDDTELRLAFNSAGEPGRKLKRFVLEVPSAVAGTSGVFPRIDFLNPLAPVGGDRILVKLLSLESEPRRRNVDFMPDAGLVTVEDRAASTERFRLWTFPPVSVIAG